MERNLQVTNLLVILGLGWAILNPTKVEELLGRLKPTPVVVTPEVQLPAEYQQLANQASSLMAKNSEKARAFVGYFQAVSEEVGQSQYLKTTADLRQLLERSLGRLNEAVALPSVTDGAELAKVLEQMLDQALGGKDVKDLDATMRQRAAEAFLAMEWSVIQASKQ